MKQILKKENPSPSVTHCRKWARWEKKKKKERKPPCAASRVSIKSP